MQQGVILEQTTTSKQARTETLDDKTALSVPISASTLALDDIQAIRLQNRTKTDTEEPSHCSIVTEWVIRSMDIVGALAILILMLPAMAVVAVLVKISSPGPVIYKQRRVGKNGEFFTLYKFRTMVNHADKIWGLVPASRDDERITRAGKILRRTRLDELPQLFNVLIGNMSLVGPRPENIYRVNLHSALAGPRLSVKPGLTGLAQIRGCYDLKPEHKIRYDYLYIQKRSILLNIYLLIQTIPVVFLKKGW